MFRKLFGGKVMPVAEQPESILYFYLTTPRVAAPRWFHEGIAVFVDTWMAGGIGRAQSGYDEMVFRAMVTRRRAASTIRSAWSPRAPKIDFQVEINSYLYGTRFITWLARRYSPEKLIEWIARRDGSRAYYAAQFRHVFGHRSKRHGRTGSPTSATFSRRTWRRSGSIPITPYRDVTARALGSVSRAYFDSRHRARIYAALQLSRRRRACGAISTTPARSSGSADIKGPLIYTVTSLAWDPDERRAVLHDRQRLAIAISCSSIPPPAARAAAERRAHRRHRVQPGRPVAVGHPPSQRLRAPSSGCRRRTRVEQRRDAARTAPWSTTSTCRPMARCCRHRSAKSAAAGRPGA